MRKKVDARVRRMERSVEEKGRVDRLGSRHVFRQIAGTMLALRPDLQLVEPCDTDPEPEHCRSTLLLQAARGPGSITLEADFFQPSVQLQAARGPGSITLVQAFAPRKTLLQAARGPGSITLRATTLRQTA